MNKNLLLPIMGFGIATLLSSCGTQKFDMYSPEEVNLQSLNRITDNEDNQYLTPSGGDNNKNLFFAVRDKRGTTNIYQKDNPISAAMSPKTNGKNENTSPTYCVATNKLAYSGRQEGAAVNDIFMIDVSQGAAIRRVTNTPTEAEYFPSLSSDGRVIVYQRCHGGPNSMDAQIWRQDLQTESSTLLCQGSVPSISHDGRSIVFVRYTPDGQNACLMIMDIDGQHQTELTDAKMGLVWKPRFSPDDQQIVFQCRKKDKKDDDLYVINRKGMGLTQLTFNKSTDAAPYWSNDGYIYFSSDRGGRQLNYQIWRFRYGTPVQTNYVPVATPQVAQPRTETTRPASTGVYHTVQSGETITDIARRYNITVRDVVKWNNLTTMTITPGMKLKVSAP